MSRNVSPYSLSLKSRLTLLFEIYKGFDHVDRSAHLAWKFKLGRNITCHYLPKGFTMFFLLTVIAILVNELLRKMVVIIFTHWIKQVKASFPWQSTCCCWAAENFPCGFDLHYKYLDSGHTRSPVLKRRSWFISLFSAQVKILQKLLKIFRNAKH